MVQRNPTQLALQPSHHPQPPDVPPRQALRNLKVLERIIFHLPEREIFDSQRVCNDWRAIITHSLIIKTKLFLRPTSDPVGPTKQGAYRRGSTAFTYVEYDTPLRINPFAVSHVRALQSPNPEAAHRFTISIRRVLELQSTETVPISVKRTFLTQPPCTTAVIIYWNVDTKRELECAVRNPRGVTIGDLAEISFTMAGTDAMVPRGRLKVPTVFFWMPAGEEVRADWAAEAARQRAG